MKLLWMHIPHFNPYLDHHAVLQLNINVNYLCIKEYAVLVVI